MQSVAVSKDGFRFVLRRDIVSDTQPFDSVHIPLTNFFKYISSPKKVFVDIGAHVGTYTIRMAKCYQQVVAIEPVPQFMETLRANVKINELQNVTTFELACADEVGDCHFLVDEIYSRPTSRGLLESSNIILVKVERLDNLIKVAGIVKMNVEGSEEAVVHGSTKLIDSCRPVFVIQHHDNTYEGFLGMRERIRSFLAPKYFALPLEYPVDPTYWLYVPTDRELSRSQEEIIRRWFHNIMQNIKTNKPWYYGLPYSWWYGLNLIEFLENLPFHALGEEQWGR